MNTTTLTSTAAPPCSTSVATSVPSSCCSILPPRGPSCTCGRQESTDWTIHTGVWERHHGGGHVTAALFPELTEGTWIVLDEHGEDVTTVTVTGGALATVDLRAASVGSP